MVVGEIEGAIEGVTAEWSASERHVMTAMDGSNGDVYQFERMAMAGEEKKWGGSWVMR